MCVCVYMYIHTIYRLVETLHYDVWIYSHFIKSCLHCCMYCFFHVFRIDATDDDESYGRLLNDNHKSPNLRAKPIKCEGQLWAVFFATQDISAGTELEYDYGGKDYPWRQV